MKCAPEVLTRAAASHRRHWRDCRRACCRARQLNTELRGPVVAVADLNSTDRSRRLRSSRREQISSGASRVQSELRRDGLRGGEGGHHSNMARNERRPRWRGFSRAERGYPEGRFAAGCLRRLPKTSGLLRVVGSVQRSAGINITSPFPEVEHRRDLAPPNDVPECLTRSTSPLAGATLRRGRRWHHEEVPWLERYVSVSRWVS
jgi:hypothetical protein